MSIRVIIVDDDPGIRVTLKRWLTLHKDLKVVGEATNGREGVALARSVKADVIVMDVRMPEMTGIEATHELRTTGVETPILIFTAEDSLGDQLDGLRNIRFLAKHGSGPRETIAAIRSLAS
jgi:DNA-binding NarL/FixJ family response regulator